MNRLIDFSSRFRILKGGKISLVLSAFLGGAIIANAAPSGGVVTSGNATINQSGNVTNINQSSQKASINWNDFSIKSNETVNFNQPNVNSITLNRVVGTEKSVIDGALNANGQVWILNSNGVLFNKNAKVNTSGLVATTAQLSDADFQAGNYEFKNSSSNSVINVGTIEVSNSGSVVLASNEVQNSGTIKAVRGKVHLVGADSYTLNLNGNSLVNLTVNKGVLDALVKNSGNIIANGGEIYLTTNAVNELLKGVVNNTGIIEANSLDGITGKVEMFAHGGEVQVGGTIESKDGFVETSGKDFKVESTTKVKAKTWLIDPTNVTVSDATAYETALGNGTDTLIQTNNAAGSDEGNIYINDTIDWTTAAKLTLDAYNNIYINKAITATSGGKLAFYYGQGAVASGNTSDYYVNAKVNLSAGDNFFTKKGSDGVETTWKVITDLGSAGSTTGTDLQGINGNLSGNYVLGADIDASGTSSWNSGAGFNPIGTYFQGNFDGLGHTIDRLFINRNTSAGLFNKIQGSIISNVGLTNANIIGSAYSGGLVGQMQSNATIKNSYITGSVSGGTNSYIGGLVGQLQSGIIENSYSTATVNGGSNIGGLVGQNQSGGTILNSYATSTVTATGTKGGLVASNSGTVTNSWYDNQANTDTTIADKDTYGKTKAQIVAALSPLEAWTAGGGASVEGYSTATALTLPQLVTFYTSNGEILFAGGFGTEANPYTITNWTQLQNINNSNILTQNYYFSLLNDLTSSTDGYATQVKDGDTLANSGLGWNPIGNGTTKFTGTFDGNNYNISNLFINRPTQDYIGLFGYTSGATISNLGLSSVNMLGNNYIGGLIGRSHNTDISKTYTSGTINGNNYIGGLVGENYIIYPSNNTTGIYVKNSYSTANVSGNDYIGGFVGYNNIDNGVLYIQNNYASGLVTASGSHFGGLIGGNYVRYNYAMQLKVENAYFNTDTTGTTSSYGGTGYTSEEFKNRANFNNWDNTIWSFYDDSVEGFAVNIRPYLKNITAEIDKPSTFLLFSQGFGTEANPYGITNWTQLQNINNINIITQSYHFDLLNDLNSSTEGYTTQVKNGDTLVNDGKGWSSIGRDNANTLTSEKFSGTFDGLGHTIDSLYIYYPNDYSVVTSQFVGLFAQTYNATIKNIGLTNINVIATDSVGGLVGYNEQSSISNSYVTGNISGYNSVGGLIGTNDYSSIRNSYSDVKITSTADGYDFGGLVGSNNTSIIENSYATGNVSGYKKIGGLVGNHTGSSSITNSYATGNVNGTGDYIGGLVGVSAGGATITRSYATGNVEGANNVGGLAGSSGNSIRDSYATGDVTGTSNVGGLLGQNQSASIYNAYSTGKVTGTGDNVRGLIGENLDPETIVAYYDKTINIGMADESSYGKTTKELQTLATFGNAGWSIELDETQKKIYPYLTFDENGGAIWKVGKYATALNYILGTQNTTYNGTNQSLTDFWTNTVFGENGSELVAGIDFKFVYNTSDTTSFKNAGTYNDISIVLLNEDYELDETGTNTLGKFVIAKKDAIVTANSDTKTYNGLTQNVNGFTASGLVNDEDESVLSGISGASASGKNAGEYITTLTGSDGNYNLTFVDGKLTIEKANAIVTANSDTKTYNGLTQNVNGFTASGLVNDEDESVLSGISGASASGKNAGEYITTLTGSDGNYNLTFVDGKLTIEKANAIVTANSDTKTYNGLTQNVNGFTASGLVNDEDESVLSGISGASASGKNAGEYITTLTGSDGNYNLTFVDGKLTIEKANAIVTANSDTKTYNGLTQNVNGFTASGLVNDEDESVLSGISGASASGKNAGEYTTTLAGSDNNYNLTFVDGKLTITPKQITVNANNLSKTFGSNDPILTYIAQGIIGDDNLDGLIQRASGENAGEYTISKGTLANQNYNITFNNGIFTIKRDTTLDNAINSIANTTAVQIPKVEIVVPKIVVAPQTQTIVIASTGNQVNVMSQPIQNQNTTMVTMGELRANQDTNTPNGNSDIRVPVGDNSVIELINGGVNLPDGVEQQFFVVNTENNNI